MKYPKFQALVALFKQEQVISYKQLIFLLINFSLKQFSSANIQKNLGNMIYFSTALCFSYSDYLFSHYFSVVLKYPLYFFLLSFISWKETEYENTAERYYISVSFCSVPLLEI